MTETTNRNKPWIIGITGGIASGKSNAAKALRAMDVPVFDADAAVHSLYTVGQAGYDAILAHFGSEYVDAEGVNRAHLGALIFRDAQARATLDQIIHPLVRAQIDAWFQSLGDVPVAAMEIPLLFESGWQSACDEVWVLTAPESVRIARLIKRYQCTPEEAMERIASQMPLEEKCKLADVVISSDQPKEDTQARLKLQYEHTLARLQGRAK